MDYNCIDPGFWKRKTMYYNDKTDGGISVKKNADVFIVHNGP